MFNAGNVRTYEYKKHKSTMLPEPDKCSHNVTFTVNLDYIPDGLCFDFNILFGSPQKGAIGYSNYNSSINLPRIWNYSKSN
jgi:hypothetical protein